MSDSKPDMIRVMILEPKCGCGRALTHLIGLHVTEDKILNIIGNCGSLDCEAKTNRADVEECVRIIKETDLADVESTPDAFVRQTEDGGLEELPDSFFGKPT